MSSEVSTAVSGSLLPDLQDLERLSPATAATIKAASDEPCAALIAQWEASSPAQRRAQLLGGYI